MAADRRTILLALAAAMTAAAARADQPLAPAGTLRAAYIVTNLAQASRDPATGAFRGVAIDVAGELAREAGVPVAVMPLESAAKVLAAVAAGEADIGFVAPNRERAGLVLYSRPYMLVLQSALVPEGSRIASVSELDAPGLTIGANTADSIGVHLKAALRHASVRESPDYSLKEAAGWLLDGTVAAFAGNRQRLAASTRGVPGLRLLPDNLHGVPQTVAVANGREALLARIDASLDRMRESGFLTDAVRRSGVDGIEVAPSAR